MAGPTRKPTSTGRRGTPPKRAGEAFEPISADASDGLEQPSRESVEVARNTSITSQEHTMPTKKALLIGIDDYGGPPNDLSCCVNDADAVARVLQTSFDFEEVHSLRNNDATLDRVDAELRWLFTGRSSSDRVLFYFSGHGFTKAQNGVVEECLVLRDGVLDTERFLSRATELPPGICTTILDSSFAGAPEHYVADGSRGTPEVEVAQAKVWRPTPDEAGRLNVAGGAENKVTEFRRFACRPISSALGVAGALAARSHGATRGGAWSTGGAALGISDEGQLALGGLLLCASSDSESAAASTSRTDGNSAFTHALLTTIRHVGFQALTAEMVAATHSRLRLLGFRQTPRLLEQTGEALGDLKFRRFLTLEPISAADTLRILSEPRYWEGVLTAATPQVSSAWAVTPEVNQMTMQQPLTGAYQQPLSAYQQPFGATPFASDDVNRTVSAIGPALASVIPALVPQIVNSVLAQQRFQPTGYAPGLTPSFAPPTPFGYSGVVPFGIQPHPLATTEDVQRTLSALTPILATVIPAIVPQIVNSILAQQRALSVPWGNAYGALDPWQSAVGGGGVANIGFQSPFGRM